MKLINHLTKGLNNNSSFGNIVIELGKSCSIFSFKHVRREVNKVAHKLTHLSREFSEMRVWIEEVPQEASTFVMYDLSLLNE